MSDEPSPKGQSRARPSLGAVFANFRTHDAPFLTKLGMVFDNNWTKVRTRKDCCGNHGQPGC